MDRNASPIQRVRSWDLPLRVFHWSLAVSVSTALVTGTLGGAWMPVHAKAGIATLGLLVFRIVWGLFGPPLARFASFAPTWQALTAYWRGQWQGIGHNPLGALSVFAMLALLFAQAASGLFSHDDIAFTGPLAGFIADEAIDRVSGWHRSGATLLWALLGLHLAAIGFYQFIKRRNLVGPMWTGWTKAEGTTWAAPSQPTRRRVLLVALVLALGAAWPLWRAVSAPAPQAAPAHNSAW
jgi:cytochrome b